jgi:hypothetical protein
MDLSGQKPVVEINASVAIQILALRGGRIHRAFWYTQAYRDGLDFSDRDELYVIAITRRDLGIGHGEESRRGPIHEMVRVKRSADAASRQISMVHRDWEPSTADLLANDWVWLPKPSDNIRGSSLWDAERG